MKMFTKAASGGGQWAGGQKLSILLFGLLASLAPAQSAAQSSPAMPAPSQSAAANFTDATSALKINFEYVASHTSRKYLIETMGSGVALLFEALGLSSDRELMLVNLDLLDVAHAAEFPPEKLNFILYNPTRNARSTTIAFPAAEGRAVRMTANGQAVAGTLEIQQRSFIRLQAEFAG